MTNRISSMKHPMTCIIIEKEKALPDKNFILKHLTKINVHFTTVMHPFLIGSIFQNFLEESYRKKLSL